MNNVGGDVEARIQVLREEITSRQDELKRLNEIYEEKPTCASVHCLECMFEVARHVAPCTFLHKDPNVCEYFTPKNAQVIGESKFYDTEINYEGLRLAKACIPGREKFRREFGNEALLTTANMLRAIINGVSIGWLFGVAEKEDEWEELIRTAISDSAHSDTLGKYYWIEHFCNSLCESVQPTVKRMNAVYRRDVARKMRRERKELERRLAENIGKEVQETKEPTRISLKQWELNAEVMSRYLIQSEQARRSHDMAARLLLNSTIESNNPQLQNLIPHNLETLTGLVISSDWSEYIGLTRNETGGEQTSGSNLSTSERIITVRTSPNS